MTNTTAVDHHNPTDTYAFGNALLVAHRDAIRCDRTRYLVWDGHGYSVLVGRSEPYMVTRAWAVDTDGAYTLVMVDGEAV